MDIRTLYGWMRGDSSTTSYLMMVRAYFPCFFNTLISGSNWGKGSGLVDRGIFIEYLLNERLGYQQLFYCICLTTGSVHTLTLCHLYRVISYHLSNFESILYLPRSMSWSGCSINKPLWSNWSAFDSVHLQLHRVFFNFKRRWKLNENLLLHLEFIVKNIIRTHVSFALMLLIFLQHSRYWRFSQGTFEIHTQPHCTGLV